MFVYTMQLVVQPRLSDSTSGWTTGWTTGWMFVYTIQPVPAGCPTAGSQTGWTTGWTTGFVSCKRGISKMAENFKA